MRRGILNKFNRGEIDTRASMRDDVEKVKNSCESMINFLPMRLGPMQFRSGTRYIGDIPNPSYLVPFVAATEDTAILEFSSNALRVWVDDVLVTWPDSNLAMVNQGFTMDLTGWTDASGTGSSTAWDAQFGGSVKITGSTSTSGIIHQTFSNSGPIVDAEHAIVITIFAAPVQVKIGQNGFDSDDIFNGTLGPGTYSFFFTPDLVVPTVTLINSEEFSAYVGEVTLQSFGVMQLTLPGTIADLSSLRIAQSADVVFCGTTSTSQFKVERRGVKSWAVVDYLTNDGPFGLINNTDITLTAAALTGDTTLTASSKLFTTKSVGEIYKLTSAGQTVSASVTAQDNGTNSIRVTGVGSTRKFTVSRTGTWVATVTLQRSTDDATWQDVRTYTGNASETYNDDLDNAILFYRLHVKTGDYTSGTVELSLVYTAGSIDGVARVVSFVSDTVVNVQVLENFGSTDATRDWFTGEWSETLGYPGSVALYEGRLWWAGLTKLWGSVSDEFQSFDADVGGDSAAIRRTIGFGPVDKVDWLAPSSRLIMGIASDEISVRSSSFGEVLSPTNTNLKSGSTRGVAPIEPVKLDDSILYVQRSGVKVVEVDYDSDSDTHKGLDLMMLNPRICIGAGGIKRIAVAREPETRLYVLMNNGSLRVWLSEPSETVTAWSRVNTVVGTFDDVIVLPGVNEDIVYVIVNRGGGRYLERFAPIDSMVNEHFDSAKIFIAPGLVITGLDHLNGLRVAVWADNEDRGSFNVSGGQITVPEEWFLVNVGIAYEARYKSLKVGHYVKGSVIGRRKRIVDLHLAMEDFWPTGITIGPTFDDDDLKPTPSIEYGLDLTKMIDDYDETPFEFNGNDDIDPRICLKATAPCTILAISYGVLQSGDSGGDKE